MWENKYIEETPGSAKGDQIHVMCSYLVAEQKGWRRPQKTPNRNVCYKCRKLLVLVEDAQH